MQKVVLIAHQDRDLVERYLDALDSSGFRCLTTHTGNEALETTASYHPQVVALQIDLPDMQGTDVCLRLKHEEATKGTTVLLLGTESAQERFVSNEVGADAFVVEPIEPDALVAKVRELFHKLWQVDPTA